MRAKEPYTWTEDTQWKPELVTMENVKVDIFKATVIVLCGSVSQVLFLFKYSVSEQEFFSTTFFFF